MMPALGTKTVTADGPIWANLVHLGHNMWVADRPYDSKLRCEDSEWRAITDRMAAVGMNMIVIDLAEGIVYPSHPETATLNLDHDEQATFKTLKVGTQGRAAGVYSATQGPNVVKSVLEGSGAIQILEGSDPGIVIKIR